MRGIFCEALYGCILHLLVPPYGILQAIQSVLIGWWLGLALQMGFLLGSVPKRQVVAGEGVRSIFAAAATWMCW